MAQEPATNKLYSAIGQSGLPRFSGYVFDEWLVELQGPKGRRVLREMSDQDPVIGAILFALEMMIRGVEWSIQPGDAEQDTAGNTDDAAQAAADFVEECLHDMAVTWPDRLSEILSFLVYGWAFHEQVYKRRDGKNSKYADGKIGWYDWPIRAQESLLKWEFADDGSILAMVQLGPPDYQIHTIPTEKGLLFRTSVKRGNPEGRSVLRNAYQPYYFKKHIQIFEGIGVERDLAGFPVMKIPGSLMTAPAGSIDAGAYDDYKRMVANIKRDDQEGLVIPSDVDPSHGHPLYQFELLKGAGNRQFNTDAIIGRHDQRIAMVVMADFIMLGHERVGSQALAQQKGRFFTLAVDAWLQSIEAVVNEVAIPRLLRMNGMPTDNPPRLTHGDLEGANIDSIGTLLANLAAAGINLDTRLNGDLSRDVMAKAGLPEPPDPEDIETDAGSLDTTDDTTGLSPAAQQQDKADAAQAQKDAQNPPTLPQGARPEQPGRPPQRASDPEATARRAAKLRGTLTPNQQAASGMETLEQAYARILAELS